MNIQELYTLYRAHYLVDTDTRTIRKNTLYFALKGANFNGNSFAMEALEKGAAYSIVDEEATANDPRILLVDDVLTTLQALAAYHRTVLNIPIIGLTGSNGKTTTKELINAVLSKKYKTTATKGNLNNHIGVPLTLLSMTPTTEIGIVEMGANHHQEIAFLADLAKPTVGYITNFGKAHLEGFGSIEGVVTAKSELYAHLKVHQKTVLVNPADAIQVEKTKDMKTVFFEPSIALLKTNPLVSLTYDNHAINTQLIGGYNYANIAAAISLGSYYKIAVAQIKKAIEGYAPANNRSQVVTTANDNRLILDAYNANPTSMKAALESFDNLVSTQKMVILGDMFELGTASAAEHQALADYCTTRSFSEVLLVGKLFDQVTTNHQTFNSFEALQAYLIETTPKAYDILIKGSRGMALERITDSL